MRCARRSGSWRWRAILIEKAIGAGELSPPDQILVQGMWENLYLQAKNQA